MDAGGLAQMSHPTFNQANGLGMPTSGLASRRGGQAVKPLSFDAINSSANTQDNGVPTPRTARGHLLAGLRTAPKTSTASSFSHTNPASPTVPAYAQNNRTRTTAPPAYDNNSLYDGPKTSMPRYGTGQQQQARNQAMGFGPHYTVDQILAPPQLHMDEQSVEAVDPNMQAHLMMANAYLAEQQQRLQQQLRELQQAATQFHGLNLNAQAQALQQNQMLYQQQQQQQQLQAMQAMVGQRPIWSVADPTTGQQTFYVENSHSVMSPHMATAQFGYQMQQHMTQQQQHTPVVQVSPPTEHARPSFPTSSSPPRRYESPSENVVPLPPPSANAFRRGHKKTPSLANSKNSLCINVDEPCKSAGPRTVTFPLTPMPSTAYGPGQGRAGEHPIRQPRNPPPMDELKEKPTAKFEGSKNFLTRTRRSALSNLVRAGLERRKDSRSLGSVSPISETAEDLIEEAPLTDNDSDSGRSGSGSLVDNDDAECSLPSSRTSTGSWGAIGSDRPGSSQKTSRETDSAASSDNEGKAKIHRSSSFASLLKGAATLNQEPMQVPRKAPMLVLTLADKRQAA